VTNSKIVLIDISTHKLKANPKKSLTENSTLTSIRGMSPLPDLIEWSPEVRHDNMTILRRRTRN